MQGKKKINEQAEKAKSRRYHLNRLNDEWQIANQKSAHYIERRSNNSRRRKKQTKNKHDDEKINVDLNVKYQTHQTKPCVQLDQVMPFDLWTN